MIKTFCDKCGVELNNYSIFTITIEGPEVRFWSDDYLYDGEVLHICRNCIKSVSDFIKAKGDNHED